MSHTRITLPITVEHVEVTGTARRVSSKDTLHRGVFRFELRPDWKQHGPFDPWQLRDDFLTWPEEHWEGFIYMGGNFGPPEFSRDDFLEWQCLLREALTTPPKLWAKFRQTFDPEKVQRLFDPVPFTFNWNQDVPEARVIVGEALKAIIATIQLDRLRGTEFKECARHDCKSPPFRVEVRQKLYCSSDCAHLVAVRNSRTRAAELRAAQGSPKHSRRTQKTESK